MYYINIQMSYIKLKKLINKNKKICLSSFYGFLIKTRKNISVQTIENSSILYNPP